jgi:multidrug efflux pump subunit AcrA (membrane-fusion protein)
MRKILLVLILAGAGYVGWQVYQRVFVQGETGEQRPRNVPVAVEVAPVRIASIRDVGSFTGTLQAESRFEVAPKIGGRLERLAVNIGDRVNRGDLIAALDDDEIVQQLDQVRAELAVARANLKEARSNRKTCDGNTIASAPCAKRKSLLSPNWTTRMLRWRPPTPGKKWPWRR